MSILLKQRIEELAVRIEKLENADSHKAAKAEVKKKAEPKPKAEGSEA